MPEATSAQSYMDIVRQQYEVKMPSGATFLIKPSNSFWYTMRTNSLPTSAIARAQGNGPVLPETAEELEANKQITLELVEAHVIAPKIRRNPNYDAGEIGFTDLLPQDALFLLDYLLGRKDKDGQAVETFPERREPVAAGASR